MLSAERQRLLINQLRSIGSLTIAECAKRFNVSEETIRRDLNTISQLIPLRRVYGGAYMQKGTEIDPPLAFRQSLFKEEKERMAAACARFIDNSDIIMLDSSDTASYIAKLLPDLHYSLTVITNSVTVLGYLADAEDINTFCIGGRLRQKAKSFVGADALATINNHVAGKAFVSPAGVSIGFGLTDIYLDECQVRRAMLDRSTYHYLLADHTKFQLKEPKGANSVCPLNRIDCVITDTELDLEWMEAMANNRVEVIIAQ